MIEPPDREQEERTGSPPPSVVPGRGGERRGALAFGSCGEARERGVERVGRAPETRRGGASRDVEVVGDLGERAALYPRHDEDGAKIVCQTIERLLDPRAIPRALEALVGERRRVREVEQQIVARRRSPPRPSTKVERDPTGDAEEERALLLCGDVFEATCRDEEHGLDAVVDVSFGDAGAPERPTDEVSMRRDDEPEARIVGRPGRPLRGWR